MSTEQKKIERVNFNVLYVGDGISRLNGFRGETALRNFSIFYEKYANTSYSTSNQKMLRAMTPEALLSYNVLWLDNISDAQSALKINEIQLNLMSEIDPTWKETLSKLKSEDDVKATEFLNALKAKRSEKMRVIYFLDEFIWEAPVGRMHSIQEVRLVEDYLNIADVVVVPTPELRDSLIHFGFVSESTNIRVVPTTLSHDFFPLFRDNDRTLTLNLNNMPKPRVLVKGITISKNVQEMIELSYKDFDITICSVGEVSEAIMGLITRNKVKHIVHWAHPNSNRLNLSYTYAIERDTKYDFMVYCMPDDLQGKIYELSMGDEDILFSIGSGTLPICGVEHVGYEDSHLYNASGLVFGKDTKFEDIKKIIRSYHYDHQKYNMAFGKCRASIENRVSSSPFVMGAYYNILLGKRPEVKNTEAVEVKANETPATEEQSTQEIK